jgi:predicted nucleotidyltransferase
MPDRIDIIRELKTLLTQKAGNDIMEVVLYGSQLHDEKTEESDYDILIVLNRIYTWPERRNLRDICYEISLKYDIIVDSKIISLQELQSGPLKNHPLYQDALSQGIHA